MILPINIQWIDVIDILFVAIFIYYLQQLVKGTVALNIFLGIFIFYIFYLLVDALQMRLLSKILGQFISVGVIALVVVFHQEIRRFLLLIGTSWLNSKFKFLKKMMPEKFVDSQLYQVDIKELELALSDMIKTKTGAIIVVLKKSELKYYLRTGIPMEARLSSQLIQNLFFKDSPLHDGAVIIKNNTIMAAKCILPLSEKTDLSNHMGLRHRAALGVTELSDAIAIVVSEQFQQISIAVHGKLEYNLTPLEAIIKLKKYLKKD